jgi:ectoine hydroxylase-related dioxygenase (phytanoyl-CoA dioxygenase family)
MIVHGAPGNSGTHRRRALSTRWTGDDARYRTGGGEIGFPVEDPGLRAGDRMTCETFPEVWQR